MEIIYRMIIFFGYFILVLALFSLIFSGISTETLFPLLFSIIVAIVFIVVPVVLIRRRKSLV